MQNIQPPLLFFRSYGRYRTTINFTNNMTYYTHVKTSSGEKENMEQNIAYRKASIKDRPNLKGISLLPHIHTSPSCFLVLLYISARPPPYQDQVSSDLLVVLLLMFHCNLISLLNVGHLSHKLLRVHLTHATNVEVVLRGGGVDVFRLYSGGW